MDKQGTYSDIEIIKQLKLGGFAFEQVSNYLFNQFKGFIPKIQSKLNLPISQVHDAYADALVKLIRHLKSGKFRGESKISSYFYKIFYNTAVDASRKNASNKNMETVELADYDARERDLLQTILNKQAAKEVILVINTLGPKCQNILIDWAYYGYSMNEIAHRRNLKNVESARSMKYKCLQKLKGILPDKKTKA